MATIDQFRSNFKGVRSNRFRVTGRFPSGNISDNDFEIYCKATTVPGSDIGVIPVGYKGRVVNFSGERSYEPWVISVYDSSVANIRKNFEDWLEKMDKRNEHEINYNVSGSDYFWTVEYMDVDKTQSNSVYKRKIGLVNAFPIKVGDIGLSYDEANKFAEFTVTLVYDYWKFIT